MSLLLTMIGALLAQAEAVPTWTLQLDTRQIASHRIAITASYSLQKMSSDRVCTGIMGAGVGIQELIAVEPALGKSKTREVLLRPAKDDSDCFMIPERATTLRYVVDLERLNQERDDPDFAQRTHNGWLFNDQAVLLRPETYPMSMVTKLTGPTDMQLFSVWDQQDTTWIADSNQLGGGAYFGLFAKDATHQLLQVRPGVLALRISKDSARQVSDTTLRDWVRTALAGLSGVHGRIPSYSDASKDGRAMVFLVGVPNSRSAGEFGTVLRRHRMSSVLWFGELGKDADYANDWLAVHELFHAGVPHTKGRASWFVEGFTTYYQEILRARLGTLTPAEMWSDLHDGLVRFGQPRGTSLRTDSDNLRKTHRYQKVYWSGAGVALLCDVKMRQKHPTGAGLDDFFRRYLNQTADEPLTDEALIAALEAETEPGFVTRLLDEATLVPYDKAYQALGLKVKDSKTLLIESPPETPQSKLRMRIEAFSLATPKP